MIDEEEPVCSFCESGVKNDDDFCPNCGSIFADNVKCSKHQDADAAGICVICCEGYCNECGFALYGRVFLCSAHSELDIFEGMARVYGNNDFTQIALVKSSLEGEGLHPFIFSRKANPLHFPTSDYSVFRPSGKFDGNMIDEIKVMVPFQEVIEAEKIVSDLKSADENIL
ncbi:MAG: hypothetical protein CVV24_02565 [Ignavibacteriae bacterium HGW-Ignavibacteriae-3]|nr:MAG: hypothetical protein CVV24_02565 [Ignavibacteriae bacterium HGW-Ignavibacteriae-3]